MVLSFVGIAHPSASSGKRGNVADLSNAEIATQRLGGLPLHLEHDTAAAPVGRVQTSWQNRQHGDLRVLAQVDDAEVERQIRDGSMRGLSLGTEMLVDADTGGVLRRAQTELSVCEEPRRKGCYITEVNGKTVHRSERFSNKRVDELDKLRAELAAERKKSEALAQKGSLYDNERRAEIAAVQSDVDAFVDLLAEKYPERKTRMQPITNWAKTMNGSDQEPEHQLPLATVLYCASAEVKRTREEASQKAADSETLGRVCKENEEMKETVAKLQKRETELEAHITEMDKRNTELDKVLREHNISSKKFDFSKISSREVAASEPQGDAAAASGSGMEVSASQANPVAAAASKDPSLLGFLLAGGQGFNRFMPAQSSHALLSAVAPIV